MTKPNNIPSIRLYVKTLLREGVTITPDKSQSNYLFNVMRLKSGDAIRCFDGVSGEWMAEVSGKELRITEQVKPMSPEPEVALAFAPLKGAAMDNVISKAVELGVSRLIPVITRHTIVRTVKSDKIEAQVIEAAEQCERLTVPIVEEAVEFEKFFEQCGNGSRLAGRASLEPRPMGGLVSPTGDKETIIFCDESGQSEQAGKVMSGLDKGKKYVLLIGPEGGFASAELEKLLGSTYSIGMTLGPRILKADTAVITALSVFMCNLGDGDLKPSFRHE